MAKKKLQFLEDLSLKKVVCPQEHGDTLSPRYPHIPSPGEDRTSQWPVEEKNKQLSKWNRAACCQQTSSSDREDLRWVKHDPQIHLLKGAWQLILHTSLMFMINIWRWMSFSQRLVQGWGCDVIYMNVQDVWYSFALKWCPWNGIYKRWERFISEGCLSLSVSSRSNVMGGLLMKTEYFIELPLICRRPFYFIYLEVIIFVFRPIFKSPV